MFSVGWNIYTIVETYVLKGMVSGMIKKKKVVLSFLKKLQAFP